MANEDAAAPGQRALTAAETASAMHSANAPYGVGRGGASAAALSPQAQAIVDAYAQDGDMKKALLKASKLPKEYKAIEAELKSTEGLTKQPADRNSTTPAQRAAAMRAAEATLNSQGFKRPANPLMDQALADFADPAKRQDYLTSKSVPDDVKAYLMKLSPLLPP
jgi:hypothetical protein